MLKLVQTVANENRVLYIAHFMNEQTARGGGASCPGARPSVSRTILIIPRWVALDAHAVEKYVRKYVPNVKQQKFRR